MSRDTRPHSPTATKSKIEPKMMFISPNERGIWGLGTTHFPGCSFAMEHGSCSSRSGIGARLIEVQTAAVSPSSFRRPVLVYHRAKESSSAGSGYCRVESERPATRRYRGIAKDCFARSLSDGMIGLAIVCFDLNVHGNQKIMHA